MSTIADPCGHYGCDDECLGDVELPEEGDKEE